MAAIGLLLLGKRYKRSRFLSSQPCMRFPPLKLNTSSTDLTAWIDPHKITFDLVQPCLIAPSHGPSYLALVVSGDVFAHQAPGEASCAPDDHLKRKFAISAT
eukprot:GHRR01023355.1.p2 GENE.GHRR01023355.1~~GHRR01023355.1.p2  ORF type:complete len:102 (-),score=0.64 GHRR01023355.1:192-497(-)